MKVWLNNLKEGDIFYHILLNTVHKCKHLGDAHNMNYRMSRIKFEILDEADDILFNEDLLGNIHEAFVNQYVYDNKEEAVKELINKLEQKIKDNKLLIENKKTEINNLNYDIKYYENKINKLNNG